VGVDVGDMCTVERGYRIFKEACGIQVEQYQSLVVARYSILEIWKEKRVKSKI
jgi:hypothetical protein